MALKRTEHINVLFSRLRKTRWYFVWAIFFVIIETFFEVIIPLIMADIIDVGIAGHQMDVIWKQGIYMFIAAVLSLGFGYAYSRCAAKAASLTAYELRRQEFDQIQAFSFSNIDHFESSSLITRLTSDVSVIQNAITSGIRPLVRGPIMLVLGIAMSLMISPALTLIFFAALPVLALILIWIVNKVAPKYGLLQKSMDLLNGVVQENLTAIRLVKACVKEESESKKFSQINHDLASLTANTFHYAQLNQPAFQFSMYAVILAILAVGTPMIIANTMQVGELTGILSYVLQIMNSLMMMSNVFLLLTRSMASINRISEVFEEKPEITDEFIIEAVPMQTEPENNTANIANPANSAITTNNTNTANTIIPENTADTITDAAAPTAALIPAASTNAITSDASTAALTPAVQIPHMKDGSVVFEDVSFRYYDQAEKNVLDHLSFTIPSGSVTGIIGATGSGKSSLVSLISRLYDINEGSLKVGQTDIKKLPLKELRDNIGVVLQNSVLFSGSVKENLLWGNPNASDEDIEWACRIAAVDELLPKLEGGLDMELGQGGVNVSGGQKQRISIARTLLKKPKILIFDDSTSAVDTKTDAKIRAGLASIKDLTQIIVAQRISSIKHCDQIIVLDDGRVDDIGTHQELLERNAIYREICQSQQEGGENNGCSTDQTSKK